MKSILFVDDDENILHGLRDLLRKQRNSWNMVFALGGPAALAELDKRSFDVVVTDMRMPIIDGAQLLERVKQQSPGTARIILSGHAEREAVLRAIPVAHQFLSKPCDVGQLRAVIERACTLRVRLENTRIRDIVGKIDRLPATPKLYGELTQAAARPDVSMRDLAQIIERDPALTSKLLQLVNSAYFGLARKRTTVEAAVEYLGIDVLKALALTVGAFAGIELPNIRGFSLDRLQERSLLVALIARDMAGTPQLAREAFTASLVHDIGRVVLAIGAPSEYGEVLHTARVERRPLHVVERELLGASHDEVGGFLLGVWGLPLAIVEPVAFHHAPRLASESAGDVLLWLHVADALLSDLEQGEPSAEELLDQVFLEQAAGRVQLERWKELAAQLSPRENG